MPARRTAAIARAGSITAVRKPAAAPSAPRRRGTNVNHSAAEAAMRTPESTQYRQMLAVLTQFRIVVANLKQHYGDIQKITGVSGTQLWTLIAISQQPGIKVGDLARELAVHQSTASNLLDRLAELGHIERVREGADQRVVSLYLTKQGERAVKIAPKPAMGLLQNALLSLPEKRVAGLREHLDDLIRTIGVNRMTGEATPLSILLSDEEKKVLRGAKRKR
ncbi:MAG: MarR family transcriptional regulator [Betaproteobacteria bacterium]|nr:MarR family transcriptional regulator [Betaproteobacteria bacterium]